MLTALAWYPGDETQTRIGDARTTSELLGRAERQGFAAVTVYAGTFRETFRRIGGEWVSTYVSGA